MVEWVDDETFRVGTVEYVCRPVFRRFRSSSERFCLLKARWCVEGYLRLCGELAPRRIVEVGVYEGGSTAFLAEVARPEKLLAVDVKPERSEALDEWITARGLVDRVVAEFGIDQADATGLSQLVEREFEGTPLDVVIADVRVWRTMAMIGRGPARLDPGTFALTELIGHNVNAQRLGVEGR